MPNIFPATVRVNPHFHDPRLILQYNQFSGAFLTLPSGAPDIRLGSEDQYVYISALEVRTQVAASQASFAELPSCTIVGHEISTPAYRVRNNTQYDHHDTANGARWGVSVPAAQSKAMRQGFAQQARGALLYGFNPQNGEGLLNAPGATLINLPPDSNGHTTIQTYDNGQLGLFVLQQVLNLKTRMYQMGMPSKIVILGPQRVLGQMEMVNIVQLVQFQRPGAGTDTTMGMIKKTLEEAGDSLVWAYDDTLIGKGAGGNDAIIIMAPELEVPKGKWPSTAEFNNVNPSLDATTLMYCDMAAPMEILSPLALGGTSVLGEWLFTSGWPVRPEALTIWSASYQ